MAAVRITKVVYEEIDSDRIRLARQASGLSAVALCRKAGLHDQAISRMERGLTKEVPSEQLDVILKAMAGEGIFEGQGPEAVLAFMRGQASFRLIEGGLESTSDVSTKGGKARGRVHSIHANLTPSKLAKTA